MIVALPDVLVAEYPDLCRSLLSAARSSGAEVYCVVRDHMVEARSVLGPYVIYTPGYWLEDAIWIGRPTHD